MSQRSAKFLLLFISCMRIPSLSFTSSVNCTCYLFQGRQHMFIINCRPSCNICNILHHQCFLCPSSHTSAPALELLQFLSQCLRLHPVQFQLVLQLFGNLLTHVPLLLRCVCHFQRACLIQLCSRNVFSLLAAQRLCRQRHHVRRGLLFQLRRE